MKAITSKEARQKLDEIIDRVSLDVEPTILCSDRGTQAVLMSLDEFNSWQETLYLLSSYAFKSVTRIATRSTNQQEFHTRIMAHCYPSLNARQLIKSTQCKAPIRIDRTSQIRKKIS